MPNKNIPLHHTIAKELEIITNMTGVKESQIHFSDDGFLSRGYVIDGGRLVFKFKKLPHVTYVDEIRNLNYLNQQSLGVNLQSVAFQADDDSYLGIYGVSGVSLEQCQMNDALRVSAGRQLGEFLRKLHALKPKTETVYPLEGLIKAWQNRYAKAKSTLVRYFDATELTRIDTLMMCEMPDALRRYGEKIVFSHADLGDGNIFIDKNGKIGIIDFNDSGYIDEASDFMDITDDGLCLVMLDAYGADENLRRKVKMQRKIRPVFVLDVYADRGEDAIQRLVRQIRKRLDEKTN